MFSTTHIQWTLNIPFHTQTLTLTKNIFEKAIQFNYLKGSEKKSHFCRFNLIRHKPYISYLIVVMKVWPVLRWCYIVFTAKWFLCNNNKKNVLHTTWTLHSPDNCVIKCTATAAVAAFDTTCRYTKATLQLIEQEEKELTTSKQVLFCPIFFSLLFSSIHRFFLLLSFVEFNNQFEQRENGTIDREKSNDDSNSMPEMGIGA